MELVKEITVGSAKIRDDAKTVPVINLIDINSGNGLVGYAEIRLNNTTGDFDSMKGGDSITIDLSLSAVELLQRVFVGSIKSTVEGKIKILHARGKGAVLKERTFKKSFHKVAAGDVIKAILQKSGLEYSIGTFPSTRYHSYVIPERTLSESLFSALKTFGTNAIAVVNDRTGAIRVDLPEKMVKKTDIVFEAENFKKVESDIIDTILDVDVEVFDEITVAGEAVVVASHRILIDGRRTRSLIAFDKT